jgi:hypothetical protein
LEQIVSDQFDLFGQATKAYSPDIAHVRNRLQDMVGRMQGATAWPWPAATVQLYRETVWPYLLGLVSDEAEAKRWRSLIEQEVQRLDQLADAA